MSSKTDDEFLSSLNDKINLCQNCNLNNGYGLAVPGIGSSSAELMVVAEAPGEEEAMVKYHPDKKFGIPLIGPAGHELQKLFIETGLNNYSLFITNVLKHRPYKNAPPTDSQKRACTPFLISQIITVEPKVIIALGKHASEVLRTIGSQESIPMDQSHRGKDFSLIIGKVNAKVFSTYHPSYACLRRPEMKPNLVKDLEKVLEHLQESNDENI